MADESLETRVTACETKLSNLLTTAQTAITKSDQAISSVKYMPFQAYMLGGEPVMQSGTVFIDGTMVSVSGEPNKDGYTYLVINASAKTAYVAAAASSSDMCMPICYIYKDSVGEYVIEQIMLGAFAYMSPPVQDVLAPFCLNAMVDGESGTESLQMFLPDDGTVRYGNTTYPIKEANGQSWMTVTAGTYWCWLPKNSMYARVSQTIDKTEEGEEVPLWFKVKVATIS